MKISTGEGSMTQNLGLNAYGRGQAYAGYTLFAPQAGTNVFLIDMRGDIVHR
jgi:hypothetical protein